jgi:PAS domain S-box-containing protein
MKKAKPTTSKDFAASKEFTRLRLQAEANLKEKKQDFTAPPVDDPTRLIHELQVAQVELQMQNDELRKAQWEIETSRDRYADLYDFAPVGYLTLDLQGLILEVNLTGAELLGETRGALVKTGFHRFIDESDRSAFHLFCRQLLQTGDRQGCEPKIARKDGSSFWARLEGIAAMDSHGIPKQYRVSLSDISHRKQAEEEITILNKTLADRAAALEAANRELDAFSYSVAHDLRAPLCRVKRLTEIVVEDAGAGLAAEVKGYLERVVEGTGRMEQMVDDLLSFSRLGRKPAARRPTQLNSLVDEVLDQLKPLSEGRTIHWRVVRLPEVDCDPNLMKIVFTNLLSNAIKYTRTREPAVIQVDGSSHGGRPVVCIRDNGVGFDMKYSDRLFGVFQRLHREGEFEGTGVGLATARRIIHKHGGRIWAEAALNKGATFYFTLGEA